MEKVEILIGYQNTAPFITQVQAAADSDRGALGFYPKSVFEEFARREKLLVMTLTSIAGKQYAGHLLFDYRFPRAHVLQMYTLPNFRQRGFASKLIDYLCGLLINSGFISIYARVADDLFAANAFWQKHRFYVQRVERGGATRRRQINVRSHELASPQLFPASGINTSNPLGLISPTSDELPLYLLDLNVLFDLGPRRLRHNDAVRLFHAERMNFFRLAISDEIRVELQRTALVDKTDPMGNFINIFPSFPLVRGGDVRSIVADLAADVFPKKSIAELRPNDWSDLRHVATAIQHRLAGLITNDSKVLSAAAKIRSKHGVEIVSPAQLLCDEESTRSHSEFNTLGTSILSLQTVTVSEESVVHNLLLKIGLTGSAIAGGWLPREAPGPIARRYIVRNGSSIVGYAMWSPKGAAGFVKIRVAVDESDVSAFSAAQILLRYLLEEMARGGPQHIQLELPLEQSYLREVATGFGFRAAPDRNCLQKIALGRVLTSSTWGAYRAELAESSDIKLPDAMPSYVSPVQQISVLTPDGNRTHVTLEELETLVTPALFCFPGRPAVITPVQKNFAEPLLEHSQQLPLLPHATVSLFRDRHYLSDPRTLKHFKRGGLILFYESTKGGGRAAIIAIARVREAYLKPVDSLGAIELKQSVLTPEALAAIGQSPLKTVTVFDNIFQLPQQIPLVFLRKIGCGRPTDLITTHPINDGQLQEILREAFKLA